MAETGVPSWDSALQTVACLKEDGSRRTLLLQERTGVRRFICKRAQGADREPLRQESDMWQALPPPLSCQTLEMAETDSALCLLRDYIPGSTLASYVERTGVLRPREAAELGVKLCRTLTALHALTPPIIHRDLKPENILLTEAGQVRLIDLGAARLYKPGQDGDTVLLGTRGYAAPEQYGSGQTDARTDIFALGKVLSFALAGEYTDVPPRLSRRDRPLERIIRRCCAYDPARRYETAAQVRSALERYLARRAVPDRALWLAGCAALILCLAAGAGGYVLGRSAPADVPAAAAGWDPFRWETDVTDIVGLAQKQDWPALADACEELVSALEADPMLQAVDPVAFWEMDGPELADYYLSRQGYEFIADNLAYGDGLTVRRLGSYEAAMPVFAVQLRSRIDYLLTDEAGKTQTSALHMLAVDGDDRNIDGCVIEILDELNRALERTPGS